jgi:hypothetical protein
MRRMFEHSAKLTDLLNGARSACSILLAAQMTQLSPWTAWRMRDDGVRAFVLPSVTLFVPRIDAFHERIGSARIDVQRCDQVVS